MRKEIYRDYATAAFLLYAIEGSSEQYRKRIREEAMFSSGNGKKERFGSPTDSAIARADQAIEDAQATIADIEAVERTISIIEANSLSVKKLQALKLVYMTTDQDSKIKDKVHFAEIQIPASEKTIFRWLKDSRLIFARERGLRTHE
jgi:hypothetical protein